MSFSSVKIKVVDTIFERYKKLVSYPKYKRAATQRFNYTLGSIDTRLNKHFKFCIFNLTFFSKLLFIGIMPSKKCWPFFYYFFLALRYRFLYLKEKSFIDLKISLENEIKKKFIFERFKQYYYSKI